MREYADVPMLTGLGAFLVERHIPKAWLAQQCGVAASTVSRWVTGTTCMRPHDREFVLLALERWQEMQLRPIPDDLLDDQREPVPPGWARAR